VEAFGMLIKFKMTLPWKPRYQNNGVLRFFLAYLIQLNVDVTGNITAKLCEVGSEFNIFCTLVTMAMAAILNFQKLPHTTVDTRRTEIDET
jgi:hypothetical protein